MGPFLFYHALAAIIVLSFGKAKETLLSTGQSDQINFSSGDLDIQITDLNLKEDQKGHWRTLKV